MSTIYIAFIKGINVGGHRSVSQGDLRQVFEAVGACDVATYIQSGNLVLRSTMPDAASVAAAAEAQMASQLGVQTAVIVRRADELADTIAENPFLGKGEPSQLHVTFLTTLPDPGRVAGLDSTTSGVDEFVVIGRTIYLHCPGGYGRTKLNNGFFEKKLRLTATTRNWRTVTTMSAMAVELTTVARSDPGHRV